MCLTVSVIIPAFNAEPFLQQTLECVLTQKNITPEVIVIDDGSTDSTPDILAGYEQVITVIRQKNQGLSAARNTGIANASGDCIVFLDADDLLAPETLASQYESLKSSPQAGISVCTNHEFEQLDKKGIPIPTHQWRLFAANLPLHLCHFNIAPVHAFMVHREAIDSIGYFNTTLRAAEDHDFWFRAAYNGIEFIQNTNTNVYYRRHAASMSADVMRQNLADAQLHLKIGTALKGSPQYMGKWRFESFLANAAGSMLTASRLGSDHQEIVRQLIDNTLDSLAHAKALTDRQESVQARLFATRIKYALTCCIQPECDNVKIALTTAWPNDFQALSNGDSTALQHEYLSLESALY